MTMGRGIRGLWIGGGCSSSRKKASPPGAFALGGEGLGEGGASDCVEGEVSRRALLFDVHGENLTVRPGPAQPPHPNPLPQAALGGEGALPDQRLAIPHRPIAIPTRSRPRSDSIPTSILIPITPPIPVPTTPPITIPNPGLHVPNPRCKVFRKPRTTGTSTPARCPECACVISLSVC